MAEPESSTEKVADAPPGGPSTAADEARPDERASEPGRASASSPSEKVPAASAPRVPAAGDAPDPTAPIAIEPDAVVETKGEPASAKAFEASAVAVDRRDSARGALRKSRPSSSEHASKNTSVAGALDSEGARPLAAYELLARSARLGDLIALTNRIVTDAAQARVSDWAFLPKVAAGAEEAKLTRDDADTQFGNVLDVLGTGGEGAAERALASALWAHAVAESPRSRSEDEDRLAGDILWLATHTHFDATPLLDRALGDEAADLWTAIADRVRRIERGKGGALGRGEAVVGSAALAASGAEKALQLCATLANEVKDPVLLRVLATGESTARNEVHFEGELVPAPRGPVATALLACTGILFAVHAVRLVARLALAYRRPAEVSLTESGVRVKTRTVVLGRTLREHEHVIPRTGLVRVVREVRFPRAAFYAGLLALALGSYIGVRSFVDGVRAASPSLLLVGLLVVAAGIGADFVLGSLLPGASGLCRLAFVPRSGRTLCIGQVDAGRADDAIARSLSRR